MKSTITLRPWALSSATRPGAQGCQRSVAATAAAGPAGSGVTSSAPAAHQAQAFKASTAATASVRGRPCSVKAQTSSASNTNKPSKAPAPSMPLCWPSTQTSQTTVANIGKAINCRKPTIHGPGRGITRATAGSALASA